MRCRAVTDGDLELIAAWNRQLQVDEGAVPMDLAKIAARLERWMRGEYDAVVFEIDSVPVGYALFRPTDPEAMEPGGVYLRQFFVAPAHRRRGNGSEAFRLFMTQSVRDRRLVLEVLETNPIGRAFWRSLGLRVYSLTLEKRRGPEQ